MQLVAATLSLPQVVKELEEKEINIISLRENIDTNSATRRFFISIIGAIAQMERELKSERVSSGREVAKSRGSSKNRS